MIEAKAPGKLVLTGEYAVLAGAPALVMAIDRHVTCRINPSRTGAWEFTSHGFEAHSIHSRDTLPNDPQNPAALAYHAIRHLRLDLATMPEHLKIEIDSRPCFHEGKKLGIGSSAACVVAVTAAFANLCDTTYTLGELLNIHRNLQGGSGSGLDVATSHHGGVIRFQNGELQAANIPDDFNHVFVYPGSSAQTRKLVQRFNDWRKIERLPQELLRLIDVATTVADPATNFYENVTEYISALRALDAAAKIGIFSEEHLRALTLAERLKVIYKPCGAGGGDIGVAMAPDPGALTAFKSAVTEQGFIAVPAEITKDGVQVRSD